MCCCTFTLETWGIITTLCRLLSFRIIQTMVGNDTTVSEATYEIFLNEGTIRTLSRAWISIVVLILIAGVFIIIFT